MKEEPMLSLFNRIGVVSLALLATSALAPGTALSQGRGRGVPGAAGACSDGSCFPTSACGLQALCSNLPDHLEFDPNVEFRKGAAATRAGDFKSAKVHFQHVVDVIPTNADALFALGVAEIALGDLAGGAKDYARALKWNPRGILAARELTITEIKLGQVDLADTRLAALKTRAAKCAGACAEANDLKDAIDAIEAERGRPVHS
jgi:tetratricopeptide (TPR) repeat protein